MGPPGTGKSTVAKRLGRFFKALGMLSSDTVLEKTPSSMQTGYVGQAGNCARDIMRQARGGVLLIDEAPGLLGNQFVREVQRELVAALEEQEFKGKISVVLAGYEEDMCVLALLRAAWCWLLASPACSSCCMPA